MPVFLRRGIQIVKHITEIDSMLLERIICSTGQVTFEQLGFAYCSCRWGANEKWLMGQNGPHWLGANKTAFLFAPYVNYLSLGNYWFIRKWNILNFALFEMERDVGSRFLLNFCIVFATCTTMVPSGSCSNLFVLQVLCLVNICK